MFQVKAPELSILATKALLDPAYALKGVPQVAELCPTTYTFPLPSRSMSLPESSPTAPKNVFHVKLPELSSLATKASPLPACALKGVPQVAELSPPTYIFPLPSTSIP